MNATEQPLSPASLDPPAKPLPRRRWFIVAMLFFAAVLNYVDKNTLSLLAPTIQKDLGFDDLAYARIQNVFQIAYTVALLASGFIVDRLGPRVAMALFVGWWSIANVATGFARSVTSLGTCRFFLGLGEAGNWTASPKAVSEWFPPRERALAIGIYTAGTPLGMTLAPLLIIGMAGNFGWRATFVFTGILGLAWLVPWLYLYRRKDLFLNSPLPSPGQAVVPALAWTWRQMLSQPAVWCLLFGRLLSDPVWFFYQNWFPKYLVSARGFTQSDVKSTWVIFMAAGIGSLVGGFLAGALVRRGFFPPKARLTVMLACALVMPLSPLVTYSSSSTVCLLLASLIALAHLAWLTNISVLVVDVAPAANLGRVFGLVAAGSSVGAILMNDFVGHLVKTTSYDRWYLIAAGLHPLAWLILWFGGLGKPGRAATEVQAPLTPGNR